MSSDRLAKAVPRAGGARRDALVTVIECLKAADPRTMISRSVSYDGRFVAVGKVRLDMDAFRRTFVIGGGKASALMAEAVEGILGKRVSEGRVIVPEAQRRLPRLSRVRFGRSTHPLPSERGVAAVRWMLEPVRRLRADDLVICLISGGGSALMPLPTEDVTVGEKQEVTDMLLRSGADIRELNCVRKHLSAFKGGRLAEALRPARVLSLIVSDVVGDDLAAVASGPTVPDPTSYSEARAILAKRGVWKRAPEQVRSLIQSGVEGAVSETPKPGSRVFARVDNVLVGSNRETLRAARRALTGMGYKTSLLVAPADGYASEFGRKLGDLAARMRGRRRSSAIVAGGETTVRVTGDGKGGRNQEVALAAAIRISGKRGITVASFGTDGIDGPTNAAGAVADWDTVRRGRAVGMDAKDYLRNNDSYSYFAKLGDLIVTGPTGTNVNDVMMALVRKK